ncbi:hypothetical protein F7D09_0135 [Bifidobacterium leontopitheci]|uniref:Uncharacterized protein n=1 Tax=Bifidobacterium leontopitheci TaxID=2650774 RepID=A0A6I1GIF5_9BIFI|nr:hypothetical protein F7D09_0135 [Bifidobacterium leontopitheci]
MDTAMPSRPCAKGDGHDGMVMRKTERQRFSRLEIGL